MSSDFKTIFWWILLLVFFVGGIFLVWSKKEWLLSQLNLGKTEVKKEEETLVKHNLGPVQRECLYLPEGIDPYDSLSFRSDPGPDALETFVYAGTISKFSVDKINQEGTDCQFYVIELSRAGKTQKIFLPWDLKSIPGEPGKSLSDTDGQVLQQFKGQKVKLTIQYQKEGDKRKFFSWKVEVM